MRTRWMAGLVGASAVILATAVSLAQRPEKPRPLLRGVELKSPDSRPWRASNELPPPSPQAAEPSSPVLPEPARAAEPTREAVDPMVAVDAFLDRNRQEADESIKALAEEAEALRARLAKVEAALGRWQAVAGALQIDSRPNAEPRLEAIEAPRPDFIVPTPAQPEPTPNEPPAAQPEPPLPPSVPQITPAPDAASTPLPESKPTGIEIPAPR